MCNSSILHAHSCTSRLELYYNYHGKSIIKFEFIQSLKHGSLLLYQLLLVYYFYLLLLDCSMYVSVNI